MQYAREVPSSLPRSELDAVVRHVRDHLASIADADDDPATRAEDVVIQVGIRNGNVLITGILDARPSAPYLHHDYDPYDGVESSLIDQAYDDEVTR